ncbi:sulfite exporter TauE/SafE family protein [Elizabethkingia anophelis]|nr:sulfite exporter TauE/SafE family protein [Elizabethkingia anophelis]
MTILVFTLILLVGAYMAGFLGSLTGLGGGVIIIPLLTLVFHVDIRYAIGAALLASIATSSGAASAYVKEGITNIRLGMFLEIATTIGAVIGAFIAIYMPTNAIAVIFGVVLIFSAAMTVRKKHEAKLTKGSKLSEKLKLNSTYPVNGEKVSYQLTNVAGGFSLMTLAGVLSGLLGIGSGSLKVLAMDSTMKIPFKVSTTTSNFMIGVTAAAASAVVYLQRGYMDPGIAFPVVLGVLAGALTGAKILPKINPKILRIIFAVAITAVAIEMIINGINHKF